MSCPANLSGAAPGKERVYHPFPPVFDQNARVLLLGTMPSPRSRAEGFYYAHPGNRFWRVMGELFSAPVPMAAEDRRLFLLRRRAALWDVLRVCHIRGAADDTIEDAEPNDIPALLSGTGVRAVFTNGREAARQYRRFFGGLAGLPPHYPLPSTGGRNAAYNLTRLTDAYRAILPFLNE